jgi:type IV fimbrial biogenesis protein FimT
MFRVRQKKSNAGFTLIELLVVIAIIGIMAAISTPNMIDWKRNADLNADIRRLYGFFQKARLEAVKRNRDCSFVGTTTTFISFLDENSNGTVDGDETVIHSGLFNGGVVATAAFSGSFSSRGLINANKTITLQGVNANEHSLVMNIRGRMRIE